MRQPHCTLPENIWEYIEKTKNKDLRAERALAYTTLLCSLEKFFSVRKPEIERNHNGKPYLKDIGVFISLSHSDGYVAVAISDEGEIGVDIQSPIDEEKAGRIDERFLKKIVVKEENINIKYFSFVLTGEEPEFNEIMPEKDSDINILSKWVYTESIIKCSGASFADISKIDELEFNLKTHIVGYKNFKIATTVAR